MSFSFLLLTVTPPVAGVLLGYLCGGRLSGLRAVRIRALWLIWLAAAVQFAQYSAPDVRHLVEDVAGVPMLALVFGIVFGWLTVNLGHWPAAIRWAGAVIVLGAAMNALVIGLNGRMPYDSAAATAAGSTPGLEGPKNAPADAGTRLAPLGDIIPVPLINKVASPGDVLISGGTVALVALAMRRPRRDPAAPAPAVVPATV
ncbi:hypothetical protein Aab01nite_26920 [Paractinoplanes abujensis]|uniref:DUF5317 domain-containing protein n=1 Tax=Paractinoplanes abujensis TaxID=882441 RepID=A0A7W7D179_9ACTN|nr:DUF5317 family protein [Actinoplanes abujensis]MBB4698413.1 hypothetical protein [Actinoplanes abujensis]GID19102.1 hypothetical protein Aab01nite_26920 [Actinoplanes abujensis]